MGSTLFDNNMGRQGCKEVLNSGSHLYIRVLSELTDSKAYIEHGGRSLIVSAKWPKLMTDTDYLHKYWNNNVIKKKKGVFSKMFPKFSAFHPKIIAIKKLYRQLKASKNEVI